MKSITPKPNILFVLFLILIQFSYGQNNVPVIVNRQQTPIRDVTSVEYKRLKKEGGLSEKYEYRINNGITIPFHSNNARTSNSAALTSCDRLPVQGPLGYSVETDDSPLLTIPIPFNFCFYGTNYTSLNLSVNGNVQFSSNSTSFSSTGFPSNAVNMIAPFWSDGESMVSSGGLTYGKIYIDPHPTYMIISWDSMGYFNNNVDLLNSFQLVLTNGLDPILPVGKNVGFYYRKMEWTTGDASGGTGGFPTTQPGTPATIGANAGNGVDYFLIGRFGVPGSIYDGPLGNSDGVSWLDGKRFFFDVCPPVGSNQAPASTLIGPCDTIRVCGNDSLIIQNAFIGPELTQTVSVTASAPSLGSSFSYSVIQNGNNSAISMMVNGNTATNGYHIVTMSATDNGTPALTSSQTFVVFVDHATPNNINAHIVFSPTIGVCPGGAITANLVSTGGAPSSYLWNNNDAASSTGYTITPALDSLVYVTISSGQCKKTVKNYIRVNPVPVTSISGNLSLCAGTNSTTVLTATNTLNFSAQAPYTYSWGGSPAPLPANGSTTTVSGGTYSVTITNKYNCSSSAVVNVIMNPTPVFTVVPTNTTMCSNAMVPLSVNFGNPVPTTCGLSTTGGCGTTNISQIGNGTNQNTSTGWPCVFGNYFKNNRHQLLFTAAELNAAGITPGKLNSIAFQVVSMQPGIIPTSSSSSYYSSAPFNYTIKIKCTNATALTTTFDNAGLVQVFSGNYAAAVGWNTFNFSQAYQWSPGSNILIDICYNLQTYYTSNPIMNSSTTVGNKCSYAYSDASPMCGTTNAATTSTERPNVRFGNCSTPPPSSFSYSWSPSTGLSSTSVSNPTANVTSSIQYSVVVSPITAATCSNVGTASITVAGSATPSITPVSTVCSNAASFSLTGLPAGGTWSLTAPTSTLGIFTPSLAAIGNNTVTYQYGGVGCMQTTTAIVPVEQFIPSTITGTISPICLPSGVVNLSTAVGTSTLGSGTWSGNGVTGVLFDPTLAGIGTQILTYSTHSNPTAALCPSSSTIAVMVNSNAQPTITAVNPMCTNASSITLFASPVGGVWQGSGVSAGGVLTPSVAAVGNNSYTYTIGSFTCSATNTTTISIEQYVPSTITGTINTLCITNSPVNLSTLLGASAPVGVGVWSGNGVTGTSFDPSQAGAGTQVLTYSTHSNPTATLCPSSSTIAVTVNSVVQPTITTAGTGPFCDNYSAQQLTASPAGGVWSPVTIGTSVTSAGSFVPGSSVLGNNKVYYTLTNAPCVKKDSINITVVHFVPASLTGALGPYCIYDPSVNLQSIAAYTGGVWSGNGVTGTSFGPSAAGAGVHTITYSTDPSPLVYCGSTETTTISVNPKPEANAVPNTNVGCDPVKVDYSTTTVNTGMGIWDFGDGTAQDTGLQVTHTYNVPGTYTATLYYTDNIGCKDTTVSASDITVYALPVASFEPSLFETTVIDGQVEFTNHSTVLNNNTYAWNIGDGLYTSTHINESYLFEHSGVFVVSLFATSPEGCKDDTSIVIRVNPDVVLYVPNAFTPGIDGLNDVFYIGLPPSGVDYSTFHLTIYDRWGELVYETHDVTMYWNGAKHNSGPVLKQEVYVWKISFEDEKKQYYEKMGHVSLLRK